MPKGLKIVKTLTKASQALFTALQPFVDNRDFASDTERRIYGHMQDCASIFTQLSDATPHTDPQYHVMLEERWTTLGTELQQYLSDKSMGQNRERFVGAVRELQKTMQEQQPIYDDLLASIKRSAQLKQEYAQGLEEERMNEQYRRTGPSGHAPTVEELCTLSATDTPMDVFFDRMLWMATMDFRGYNTIDNYQSMDGNFLKETYDRLNMELADAPITRQMEFMERWERHMLKTRDLAHEYYKKELGDEPVSQEKQDEAMKKLAVSPLYEACDVQKEWRECFNQTMISSLIVYDGLALPDTKSRQDRISNQVIGDMVGGGMMGFLRSKKLVQETTRQNAARIQEELMNSGMLTEGHPLSQLGRLYDKLIRDKRDASPIFTNMRDALRDFARLDHRNIADPEDYRNKLSSAQKAVQTYLVTHSGNRSTDKGKERQALADDFKNLLGTWKAPAPKAEARLNPETVYDSLTAARQQITNMVTVLHGTESAFSRDSAEFKAMKSALEAVDEGMKQLPEKANFTAEMAKEMAEKLEKLGAASKAYHDAKAPQQKNERRLIRFQLSEQMQLFSQGLTQQIRRTGDPQYNLEAAEQQAKHSMAGRMMGVIADLLPDQRQFFANAENTRVLESSPAFRSTLAGMTVNEMQQVQGDRRQVGKLVQVMLKNGLATRQNAQPQNAQPQNAPARNVQVQEPGMHI